MGVLAYRRGRDRRYVGVVPGLEPVAAGGSDQGVSTQIRPFGASARAAVEFAPPKGMLPAEAGVLIDERADPLDVTATIVDLAVRKYLHITELERRTRFSKRDWQLDRLTAPAGDTLQAYEKALLDALFASGEQVKISKLKEHFAAQLAAVQGQLYARVVSQGWFDRRPDKTRSRWHGIATWTVLVGAGLTWLLAAKTHLGLLGLPVVLVGLVLGRLANKMPARTPKGSAALTRLLGFRTYLHTAEANQLRFEEKADVFARYLPFAIIFGETDRWAKAFHDLGADGAASAGATYWYTGPSGWDIGHLGDSMSGFATTTSGSLAATPHTSSSGGSGGFSGGGGGGGGGGSW